MKTQKLKFFTAVTAIAVIGVVVLAVTNANTTQNFSRFPGDPNPQVTGKAYWGSALGGNTDPTSKYENATGKSLSVRRTYWDMRTTGKIDSSINSAKNDIDNNRLPFISYKLKHSWVDTANGADQAAIDDLLRRLDNLGAPVWLTIHHEPEGSATTNWADEPTGPSSWVDMQRYIRSRIDAVGTNNIAFVANMMTWTWDSRSGRNTSDWLPNDAKQIWDVYTANVYCETGCLNDGITPVDMDMWKNYEADMVATGIPYGVGEWGYRWNNDARAASDMQKVWDHGFNNGRDIVAWAYFDSDLNSPTGGWTLSGGALQRFNDILKNDNRVMRISDLGSTNPNPDPVCEDPVANNTGQPLPCTYDPDPPTDLPIEITSPSNGATVSGIIGVTTGPDTDVQELSFRVNGSWQSNDADAPFTWQWDTTQFPDGENTLTIRARRNGDPGGVYTEKSIQVTINNSSVPPTTKPCDFNNDGNVNLTDLAQLLANYGKSVTVDTNGDCDGNGEVTLADLAKLLSLYG